MVTKALFVDDKENISKDAADSTPEVTYEAIIIGGPRSGQVLTNVRDCSFLGGETNYSEKTWKPSSTPNFARKGGKPLSQQDGDCVYIQFQGGNLSYPIIIGGAPQYKNKTKTGTKKADAPRLLFEYNGVNVLIDNKGQLLVTRKGGTAKDGGFTPGTSFETKVHFLEKSVVLEDKNGNKITIDSESKKISVVAPEQFELTSKVIKLMADNSFTLETQTVNISAGSVVNIDAPQVLLGGGGPGVARLGDTAIGSGNHGAPVVSTIIQGSFVVKAG
jgi:hypothetical protein